MGTKSTISTLQTAELKQLITSAGLDHSDCLERGDLILRAQEAQRTDEDLRELSVSELKALIESMGCNHSDCLEREELIIRAREARQLGARAPQRALPEEVAPLQQLILSAGLTDNDCVTLEQYQARVAAAKRQLEQRYTYKVGDGCEHALEVGKKVYRNRAGGGTTITQQMLQRVGGRDGWVRIFQCFYEHMFADPRMSVLFGWRNRELATAEHGRRLGTFILAFHGLDDEYSRTAHDGFGPAHQHAKRCPMRPDAHRRARAFTKEQRDAWLGHLSLACDEQRVPKDIKKTLLNWALDGIHMYGPFINE